MLTTPTIPAASTALTPANSWNSGDSCEITEIPAEVFRNRSSHSTHHCQVFSAPPNEYSRAARCEACEAVGLQPSGFQFSGGFCMKYPDTTVTTRNAIPRYANVCSTPMLWISRVATGAVTSAPAPNPPTAIPVMSPLRSGNHFTSTATGTMYANPNPTPPINPYVR